MSKELSLIPTDLPEVFMIKSNLFKDDRGSFYRAFDKDFFAQELEFNLCQINICFTKDIGTIRGLHFQDEPFQEQKIVRCISGSILDVAVDIRPKSPTYLRSIQLELSYENNLALLIPKGFAHGYQTREENSIIQYCTSEIYKPSHEMGMRFNDPKLKINWDPKIKTVSEKDMNWPVL